jgi:hypothetical protein
LPHVDKGEDLDLLVNDEHAPLVDLLLTRSTDQGTIPCDVYSVRGRIGYQWKNTAYYPPHLAAGLLNRSVPHPSGARVLCPEDHFHTLAFHALYHKGYASGLPVSATEGPKSDDPEHDYLRTLSGLATELGVDVDITMEDLDRFLHLAGWRPALDTLAKWSPNNPWVEQLHESLIGDDPAPAGLAVLVVRERAADPGSLQQIARLAREHELVQVAIETLTSDARERASRSLRGGAWGKGPYPSSGGEPAAVLVVLDPLRVPPSPEQLAAHPGLDNGRLPVFKDAVRTWWNEQQSPPDRCNILHTSDSAAHARHYLEEIFQEEAAGRLVQLAVDVQASSAQR